MKKDDKIKLPQYLPLIVKARLHTGGREYEKIKQELKGQGFTCNQMKSMVREGNYFDGLVLYLSKWNWDNHESWHLYSWDDKDDEKVMLGIYEAEQYHPYNRYKGDFEKFQSDWKNEEYDPGMTFTFKDSEVLTFIAVCVGLGRYKAIYNNLIPELMAEFKANRIVVSVIYEASGLPADYQQQAAEMFRENEVLTIADIKQLKKNYEAAQQIPGQMDMNQFEDQQQAAGEETTTAEGEEDQKPEEETETGAEGTEGAEEAAGQQPEYVDPQPEQITSLCYSCTHYEDCHDKTATVTSCNAYKNRREAQKTDEERYNEEQAAIDRETRKKLREKQQEEKMQQLPSDGQQKQRDIRLTPQKYAEITAGKLTFLLLKKDGFKIGEELELGEFTDGKATGRKIDVEIVYIWADWTGLDDDYCIIGFNVTAFDE